MEVVIYHCRGKDKFIPLGYASTTFSITGGQKKENLGNLVLSTF